MIKVALTIDDLPKHGEAVSPYGHLSINHMILDSRKKFSLPSICGFVNGHLLNDNPEGLEVLKQWVEGGCFLGNHTYSHFYLNEKTSQEYIADIIENEKIINQLQSIRTKYFRYPFLLEGETEEKVNSIKQFLETNDYLIAPVTFDFLDFYWNQPVNQCLLTNNQDSLNLLKLLYVHEAIIHLHAATHASKKIFGRDICHILLLHIGIATAFFLPDLIQALQSEGCQFIELDQALLDEVYQTDPRFPTPDAPNFLIRWAMLTKTQINWPLVDVQKINHIAKQLPKINDYDYTT